MSTLSCESSVLILSLVTWDRFIFVTQPLARKQSSPRTAILTLVILWSLAVMVSLAPLSTFTLEYFGDEFYGSNGVCLSLHIHDPYAKVKVISIKGFYRTILNFISRLVRQPTIQQNLNFTGLGIFGCNVRFGKYTCINFHLLCLYTYDDRNKGQWSGLSIDKTKSGTG